MGRFDYKALDACVFTLKIAASTLEICEMVMCLS